MHFGSLAVLLFQDVPTKFIPVPVNANDAMWLWIALGVGVLALIAAFVLARIVVAGDTGTSEMQVISNAIREGAEAFLSRQYRTIGIMAVVLAILIFLGYFFSPRTHDIAGKTDRTFRLSDGKLVKTR